MTRHWFPLLGLAFAIAGADKLYGQRGYRTMFRHWGWSERRMRAVGLAELAGGAMLMCPAPYVRPTGGAVLVAASATMLSAEVSHGEGKLGAPRLALLLAAATALIPRSAR